MSHLPRLARRDAAVQSAEPPFFHARLHPHRSLSAQGFTILAMLLTGLALAGCVFLVAAGFWPASFFLVCNALFLLGAIRLSRADAARFEQVVVNREGLAVLRYDRRERLMSEERLPLFGLTLNLDHDPDYGLLGLEGRVRDKSVVLARDLAPSARAEFAEALVEAMRDAGCAPREFKRARLALVAEG